MKKYIFGFNAFCTVEIWADNYVEAVARFRKLFNCLPVLVEVGK